MTLASLPRPQPSVGLLRLGSLTACLLVGTGCWGSSISCFEEGATDATVLAEAEAGDLTCGEAARGIDYLEMLAARRLTRPQRERVYGELEQAWSARPAATRQALEGATRWLATLAEQPPRQAALSRSQHLYGALRGEGPLAGTSWPETSAVLEHSAAVWATDDDLKLVLTEMDVEGWIRYASLCREVQGGPPLRVSIADRVGVYRQVTERFAGLDPEGKKAMTAIGPVWRSVHERWKGASYLEQQRWIGTAPLPPPMTATSKGYLGALLEGDVVRHVEVLHDTLGPLSLAPVL